MSTIKETPSYVISVHVGKTGNRIMRMEVPVERVIDKPSREAVFSELMDSALNMFGLHDLSTPTPEPSSRRVDARTLELLTPVSISCATTPELHYKICNQKHTRHYRRMALRQWERRCNNEY